jgi:hypothetical protein
LYSLRGNRTCYLIIRVDHVTALIGLKSAMNWYSVL